MSDKSYFFVPLAAYNVPMDDLNQVLEDLYVYLPNTRRYVVFIPKGEKFSVARQTSLKKHIFPFVFIKSKAAGFNPDQAEGSDSTLQKIVENNAVNERGSRYIAGICRELFEAGQENIQEARSKLEKTADSIMEIVAPDVKNIRKKLLENANYLWIMNDSSAIASLATLFAHANNVGVDSKRPIRDLVCASLIMDFPLAKVGENIMVTYIRAPQMLNEGQKLEIKEHPIEAYKTAQRKLEHFSENAMELILCHHELYNGLGYPKGLRSGTLSVFVQSFIFAVDVFEQFKAKNMKSHQVTLNQIVLEARQEEVEAHLRRHSRAIVDSVIRYMGIQVI